MGDQRRANDEITEDHRVTLAREVLAEYQQLDIGAVDEHDGRVFRLLGTLGYTVELLIGAIDERLEGADRLSRIEGAVGRIEQALTREIETFANALGADENEQERHGELINTLTSVRDALDEHVSVYGQLDTIRRDVDEIRRVLTIAATSRVEKTAADMEAIERRRQP